MIPYASPQETPSFAPAWLRVLWNAHCAGGSPTCPKCGNPHVPLALSVGAAPRAYRFQCVGCGFRTPWFDALSSRHLVVLGLDPITHGAA